MRNLFGRLFGARSEPSREDTAPTPAEPFITLDGTGRFQVSVVGEASYRHTFQLIFGPRTADGIDQECDASLRLENSNPYDDQAVRVDIEGRVIGYLSRGDARRYRHWLSSQARATDMRICRALVRGGWARGSEDTGDYGVYLDLPVDAISPPPRRRTVEKSVDTHGQPDPLFNLSRRIDRSVNELLGLTKGIIADGVVTPEETELLRAWVIANPEAASAWPGNVLADRIARIYEDDRVEEDEREDLRVLLQQLSGGANHDEGNPSTRLPLNDPAPQLRFDGAVYVFTGRFFSGTRRWCENLVESRGGVCVPNVTNRTNFLVIGELGSRDWKHSSFGRKIQKAVEVRSDGRDLAIIAEEYWHGCLSR
jgi:hypothetical protein